MSANLAYARPLSAPAPARHPHSPLHGRPMQAPRSQPAAWAHVEVVTTRAQRKARPKLVYAVVTATSLFVIFAAQLLLSIVVSDGAFQIDALQGQQKELLRTEQALIEDLDRLDSPQNLAGQAAHLGMVPNPSPLALDLRTGGVYGMPGTADPTGCGGACNLVPNALLAGVPLVDPSAPQATQNSATAAKPPVTAKTAALVTALPAPVTH